MTCPSDFLLDVWCSEIGPVCYLGTILPTAAHFRGLFLQLKECYSIILRSIVEVILDWLVLLYGTHWLVRQSCAILWPIRFKIKTVVLRSDFPLSCYSVSGSATFLRLACKQKVNYCVISSWCDVWLSCCKAFFIPIFSVCPYSLSPSTRLACGRIVTDQDHGSIITWGWKWSRSGAPPLKGPVS